MVNDVTSVKTVLEPSYTKVICG